MQKETLVIANELEEEINFLKAKIRHFNRDIEFISTRLKKDYISDQFEEGGYFSTTVPITKETSDFLKNEIEIFEDMIFFLEKEFESL